jgi:hypothetical protein
MNPLTVSARGLTPAAVLIAVGLALAGCGSSSSSSPSLASGGSSTPTSTGSGSSTNLGSGGTGSGGTALFPVAVGNTWVYDDTLAGHESGTTTNMITAVMPDSGGQKVTITTHSAIAGLPSTPTTLTYQFNSDGSISVPFTQIGNSSVTVKAGGVVWPPASALDSGQPTTSTLSLQIKEAGQTVNAKADVTVKGGGTASVTVPAGTYQATQVVETISEHVLGIKVSIEIRTWLANGVGPVKSVASTTSGSVSETVSSEVLKSFKKG